MSDAVTAVRTGSQCTENSGWGTCVYGVDEVGSGPGLAVEALEHQTKGTAVCSCGA